MESESITTQELATVISLKQRIQEIEIQKRIADLELQIEIFKIFVRHGLIEGDMIHDATGKISRIPRT